MIRFHLLGFPVQIHWLFWLTAVILGGGIHARGPQDWLGVGIWVAAVFLSVIWHELGHALAAAKCGLRSSILLHGMGGLTRMDGGPIRGGPSVMISLAGPGAGLLLAGVLLAFGGQASVLPPAARSFVSNLFYINFVWSLFNLLPIVPLDGGQVLAALMGPSRARATAIIGVVVAGALCLWAFAMGLFWAGLMLGYLAYSNWAHQPVLGGVKSP